MDNLVQKVIDSDIILKMLNDKPQSHPLGYFGFHNQLEEKSTSLDDFWDTELYDNLGLVESTTARQNAMDDDEELDDDLYEEDEETANEINVEDIKKDIQKYTDSTDTLYCDLMDNHVLSVQEIISRLTDYRSDLVDNYLSYGKSNEHSNSEKIQKLKDTFGEKLQDYLKKEGIIIGRKDILPRLKKELSTKVITANVYDTHIQEINDIVLDIDTIKKGQIALFSKSDYQCIPIHVVFIDLKKNYLD